MGHLKCREDQRKFVHGGGMHLPFKVFLQEKAIIEAPGLRKCFSLFPDGPVIKTSPPNASPT